jgi:hypothetical protein
MILTLTGELRIMGPAVIIILHVLLGKTIEREEIHDGKKIRSPWIHEELHGSFCRSWIIEGFAVLKP